jgi:hypothetical protein
VRVRVRVRIRVRVRVRVRVRTAMLLLRQPALKRLRASDGTEQAVLSPARRWARGPLALRAQAARRPRSPLLWRPCRRHGRRLAAYAIVWRARVSGVRRGAGGRGGVGVG